MIRVTQLQLNLDESVVAKLSLQCDEHSSDLSTQPGLIPTFHRGPDQFQVSTRHS
jgi:hypothetical protein